jgi:hypothetical protein
MDARNRRVSILVKNPLLAARGKAAAEAPAKETATPAAAPASEPAAR